MATPKYLLLIFIIVLDCKIFSYNFQPQYFSNFKRMLNRKASVLMPIAQKDGDSSRKASFLNNSIDRRSSLLYAPSNPSFNRGPRKSIFPGARRTSYMSLKSSESNGIPLIKLQNTYRTELNDNEKFNASAVEPKMREILNEALNEQTYIASNANILSKEISQDIMREMRNIVSPRYKLVSHVSIGQLKGRLRIHFSKKSVAVFLFF